MKKITFFLVAFLAIKATSAQVTFESYSFLLDSIGKNYFKGISGVAGDYPISDNGTNFLLRNDTSAFGDYWSGFAISRLKDSTSIAYDTNDCANFPAMGHNNSSVYLTAFQAYDSTYNRIIFSSQKQIAGLYISNSTIAYRSMQNGDFVAKKFGGVSGNDSDFFRITFYGWYNGNLINNTVTSYLADFRDNNNANDYILNNWKYVDLLNLGFVDSISYYLESSDNGNFGMNTPAFFCLDNITFQPDNVQDISQNEFIKIYPNPIKDNLIIDNKNNENLEIILTNNIGQILMNTTIQPNNKKIIDVKNWAAGMYFVKIKMNEQSYFYKIIK